VPPEPTAEAYLDLGRALVGIAVHSVHAAADELTVAQYRLLAVLDARGPVTITDVAALLGVAQSNASRHCDRLQKLGLLARQRSEADGRVVLVAPTAAGHDVVSRVTRVRVQQIDAVLERMRPEDRERAVDAVAAFNRAAAELDAMPWLSAAW
jgi:DNA-binding MarR family transcriptional regulator